MGDVVRVLSIPDWLVADLPDLERAGILACVGKEMVVNAVDRSGGVWLGFGQTQDATYKGRSFLIEADRIELVTPV